jgi:hypothetical protein
MRKDPFENIFGLPKKKKVKSPVNVGVISMFKGKGNPMLGDKVTKPQRQAMRKSPWADWDGDGVINGLDCAPKNRKKHMAWREPKEYQYVEKMPPREFLKKSKSEDFGMKRSYIIKNPETGEIHMNLSQEAPEQHFRYYDSEMEKMQPIDRLGKIIKSPDKEVSLPFVEDRYGDHEGRHRAFAAERAGIKEIPVRVPAPASWRTDEVFENFKKHATHLNLYGSYEKEWKERIQSRSFPEEYMDDRSRKAYIKALRDSKVIR